MFPRMKRMRPGNPSRHAQCFTLSICYEPRFPRSLRQSMKANEATPTNKSKEESTVFADVESMKLEDTCVRLYDCAGQVTNVALHLAYDFRDAIETHDARHRQSGSLTLCPPCRQHGARWRKFLRCRRNDGTFLPSRKCFFARCFFNTKDL